VPARASCGEVEGRLPPPLRDDFEESVRKGARSSIRGDVGEAIVTSSVSHIHKDKENRSRTTQLLIILVRPELECARRLGKKRVEGRR
jgi:hypothetical protein